MVVVLMHIRTCTDKFNLTCLQVINGYGRLLMRRYSRVHVMTTFFYSKLSSAGFKGVERWMKKVCCLKLQFHCYNTWA